jgi:PAS domain-containing protein
MVPSPQIAKRLGSDEDELLSALMESMVDAVYAVDDQGVVLFANPAAVSILGYQAETRRSRPSRRRHATAHGPRGVARVPVLQRLRHWLHGR